MKKNLNNLLNNAAAFENKTALWSEDELLDLLKNAPVTPTPPPAGRTVQPLTNTWRNIMFGTTLLAGATAIVLWLMPHNAEQIDTNADVALNTVQSQQNNANQRANVQAETKVEINNSLSQSAPGIAANSNVAMPERTVAESNASPQIADNVVPIPEKIKAPKVLDLTTQELEKLGVKKQNNNYVLIAKLGVDYNKPYAVNAFYANADNHRTSIQVNKNMVKSKLAQFEYDTTQQASVMNFTVTLDELGTRAKLIKANEATSATVYPIIISHDSKDVNGSEASKVMIFGEPENENEMNRLRDDVASLFDVFNPVAHKQTERNVARFPLISKLIPVRIQHAVPNSGSAEIILWYYPTDEFISKLPSRYADQIRKESERIEQIEQKNEKDSGTATIQQRYAGEYQYTDVARSRSGAVEILSVGPNPARENATLRYKVSEPRTVHIVLYDMQGAKVAELATANAYTGETEAQLQLNNLASGAYLITLVTDRGEQAIQRLIIQN
ncbi:MAG: T9SS type A sorting domain-containing protein [Candidatus Kapabacteria bacterium]|nr:T9SS type A sorting domain-containing protein [Candidatus Kapabacteria bacterium]